MSRQQEITAAAALAGLAEAHAAAWGDANPEATGYRSRVNERLSGKTLNSQERARFRERALKRAREYVDDHARDGSIPAGQVPAIMADVAAKVDGYLA